MAGATITIFTLLPNGQRGSQIVPGAGQPAIITQANGSWTAAIPGDVTGPLLVVATGGTFLDEVTGRQIPIGDTTDILGLLPAGATTAAITPITHAMALAAQTALQRAAATGTSPDVNAMVSTVIFNATQTFGFDPVRTLPPDPRNLSGQSTVAVHYAAILVGLSQLLADARGREAAGQEPTFDVGTRLVALAQDLIDGVIDGQQAGQPITAPNGQVVPSLIPTPQTKTLADVVNIFALFPPTDTGLDDTTLQSTLSTDPVAIVPPPGGNLATPQTTNPQNQAPAPAAPAIRILGNTPGTSQVSPNDPDAGESFTFVVSARPDHGIATVNTSGLVTYTPDVGFTGTDSFDVTVIDNGLVPLTGTVTIAVTVTGNTAPAPTAPAIRIFPDALGTSQVSPNDPDASESFTFVVGTKPAHGTAIVNRSGLVIYIPDTGFTGTDSIVVTVSDNGNPSKTGTVTIAVTVAAPPNTAPAPTAPAIRTTQNTPGTSRINPNDSDVGETFTFAITTRPAHGTASVNATGRVTYTPASNFTGSDSLTITVTDNGTPPLSGAVTINVTVANRPPAPTAPPIGINTLLLYPGQKFAAGRFPVSVTVADVNGDGNQDLIVANVGSNNVSVLLGQGNGTFQPEQRFATGSNPVSVAVADVNGDSLSDLIVANQGASDVSVLLRQQQKSDTTQVTPNDPDVGQTVTFAVTKKPINGTASVDASGVVTYIPALNFTGSDSLVVTVTDNGVPPLAGTVTIAVTVKAP